MESSLSSTLRSCLAQRYEERTGRSAHTLIEEDRRRLHEWSQPLRTWIDFDELLEWLLMETLRGKYCYDGLRDVFEKEETDQSLLVTGVFWHLRGRGGNTASFQLQAELQKSRIHYEIQATPGTAFSSGSKMWKAFYLYAKGDTGDWEWHDRFTGEL